MIYWNPKIQDQLTGQERKKFVGKRKIIQLLYRKGAVSGTDITKAIKLSVPTTLVYINELVDENIIEFKRKGESIGGRRPNIYGLVKNSVYLLGIDIGQNKFSVSIFNNELENMSGRRLHRMKMGKDTAGIDVIYDFAQELILETGIDQKKIMGVGINIPGLVDSYSGRSYSYLCDSDQAVRDIFQKKFNIPVYIENDSKARALAELMHGDAKGTNNTLVIQLDWGVGMGMILNGKLYRGNSGFSGEFSHVLIEEEGQLCTCGKRGCLETIASGKAMVETALKSFEESKDSALFRLASENDGQITPEDIVSAAKEGDQLAISLINTMGQKLGKGISYLIQILNPDSIIFGGSISLAGEYLLNPINQALFSYCIPRLREDTTLKVSRLGSEAGVLGAVSLVLERSMNRG